MPLNLALKNFSEDHFSSAALFLLGKGLVTSYSGEFREILFYITFGCVDGRNQCNAEFAA